MNRERRQFSILYRDSLSRMIDLELLSRHGDIGKLLGQFGALLAALSFVLAVLYVPRYSASRLSPERLAVAAWGDEEFLIATTMAVVGILAVIAWNTVLPDRRDALVLGPLPVRARTFFLAKSAALLSALGITVVAVNLFIGTAFPFLVGGMRSLVAYWVTVTAAGLFVFTALLAVQGAAAQLLPYRLFLRVSAFLQLAALFAIVSVYFLTPPLATPYRLSAPENQRLLEWLPSFWFLGLFQELHGGAHAVFGPLAGRALRNLLISAAVATGTYAMTYWRQLRRIVEQPDIAPGDRTRPASRLSRFAAAKLFATPLERAILLFTARTIGRSRQHRLLLAVYGGIGLAIALAFAKDILYGRQGGGWNQVTIASLTSSLVLLVFAVGGTRAVFAMPVALRANWVFRITAVKAPAAYFGAVRQSLLLLAAVPVWLAAALAYFTMWPGRPAIEHLAVMVAAGLLTADISLRQFRKIPFTCSYLPGRVEIHRKLGLYGFGFVLVAGAGTGLEFFAMEKPARFAVFFAIVGGAAWWAWRNWREFAWLPHNQIQFEDHPADKMTILDLEAEPAADGEGAYIAEFDPEAAQPRGRRWKKIAIGTAIVLTCGFTYERYSTWREHRRFPQVGRSFDVGGRSLNISCVGEGSPAVILESDFAVAGYRWLPVQRQLATLTRTCWYDRAGYGWSDPAPFPRHSDRVARDLRRLLTAARIAPPYVLVGHGMGTYHVRVFYRYYRSDVAGMVLADPFNEDTTIHVHNHVEAFRPAVIAIVRVLGFFGWFHLITDDPGAPPPGMTATEWATARAMVSQTKSIPARIAEPPLWISGELARAAGGFADLPLVVLSGEQHWEMYEDQDLSLEIKRHEELARRSSRGIHTVVEGSGHWNPYERPDALVDAVRQVVATARLR